MDKAIIDVTPVIRRYSVFKEMYPLFRVIPMSKIISCLLSASGVEYLLEITRPKIEAHGFLSQIELFYEHMAVDLYNLVCKALDRATTGCFYFDQWVDSTSVLISLE